MPTITISTQAEYDSLPEAFGDWTEILIDSPDHFLMLHTTPAKTERILIRGHSDLAVGGDVSVDVYDQAHVVVRSSASVLALGHSEIVAIEWATVIAGDYSHVEAKDQTRVLAHDYCHVEASGHAAVFKRFPTATVEVSEMAVCWDNARVVGYLSHPEGPERLIFGGGVATQWGPNPVGCEGPPLFTEDLEW
jgi:hypothetical protein